MEVPRFVKKATMALGVSVPDYTDLMAIKEAVQTALNEGFRGKEGSAQHVNLSEPAR